MKHGPIVMGFIGFESADSIILSLYKSERIGDLFGIIALESTRPAEIRAIDEIILRHIQIEPLITRGHLEYPLICKPEKKVWPKDHLAYKERRKVGHIKHKSRRYLRGPF